MSVGFDSLCPYLKAHEKGRLSSLGYKDILFGTIEQENDNEEVTVTLL